MADAAQFSQLHSHLGTICIHGIRREVNMTRDWVALSPASFFSAGLLRRIFRAESSGDFKSNAFPASALRDDVTVSERACL